MTKYMSDLMIDIETLGIGPKPVVIQIGARFFDRNTKELGLSFCQSIDPASAEAEDFETDQSTIDWWSKQDQNIYEDIISKGRNVEDVLNDFGAFINSAYSEYYLNWNDIRIWSHATFDFPIIQTYLKHFGIRVLPYKYARDIRTLIDLANIDLNSYNWSAKTHNALDDCDFQINYVCDALWKLEGKI